MENETTKNRQLKSAFLLDPTSLRSLQTILTEIRGPVEYRVKFSDGCLEQQIWADIETFLILIGDLKSPRPSPTDLSRTGFDLYEC